MTLKIKGTKETNSEIQLIRRENGVEVWIDNEYMAVYLDDGTVIIHGKDTSRLFESRWDK